MVRIAVRFIGVHGWRAVRSCAPGLVSCPHLTAQLLCRARSRRVLKRHGLKVDVEYDNGERETVLAENVSPLDVPVEFGGETVPLQVHTCMPAQSPLPARSAVRLHRTMPSGGQHAATVSRSPP